MPKTDIYDSLRELSGAVQKKIVSDDKTLDQFDRNIVRVQKEMMNKVLTLVNSLELDPDGNILSNSENLGIASKSLATLRRSLTQSGYKDLVADHVAGFSDQIDKIVDIARTVGIDYDLAVLDPAELRTLQGEYLSEFENLGDNVVKELKKGIYDSTLNASPVGSLVDNLGKVIQGEDKKGGKLKNHAGTYANTALMGYDRYVNNKLAEETGFDDYVYLGPSDSVTRPFCSRHINKVYTLDEIKAMQNGQGLSVRQYGGGWRCRHFFQVVDPDFAQEIKDGALDDMPGPDKKETKAKPPKPQKKQEVKKPAPKETPPAQAKPKPLTQEDRDLINLYTFQGDRIFNSYLRGEKQVQTRASGIIDFDDLEKSSQGDWKTKADLEKMIDDFRASLSKLPKTRGETYRGELYVDYDSDGNAKINKAKNKEVFEKYKPGSVVTNKAFTSTSKDPAFALENFTVTEDGLFFKIKGKTGREITEFSSFKGEKEVLMLDNTSFVVTRTERGHKIEINGVERIVNLIELEEV